ncbi:hypothetical protein [Thalassobacillus hwangdonensis]|uniref:Uncharacterized protein n=1 Tax=Thalassobacillus hwangdonensis TaxID=546108 RepID=A0ABW3L2I1_9BACI
MGTKEVSIESPFLVAAGLFLQMQRTYDIVMIIIFLGIIFTIIATISIGKYYATYTKSKE